jgi:hypothetical protein
LVPLVFCGVKAAQLSGKTLGGYISARRSVTQAASQAAAFYRDVARTRRVWTIEDERGYPAPMTLEGKRAMPFWSSLARAKKIVRTVPAYAGFTPVEFSWEQFKNEWLPELRSEGQLVGVNWSSARATGYDEQPDQLLRNIEYYLQDKANVLPFPGSGTAT